MDACAVEALLGAMSKQQLRALEYKLDWRGALRDVPRQHMYVNELAVDMDTARAGSAAGYNGNGPYERHGLAIARILDERERDSELRGEYVRKYVHGLLEVCVTDFFYLDADGDWYVDPKEFSALPREIKRYIESVEIKIVHGERRYKVNIVSKTAALVLAAKLTGLAAAEKPRSAAVIPWEQLASDSRELDDPIEAKILSVNETMHTVS